MTNVASPGSGVKQGLRQFGEFFQLVRDVPLDKRKDKALGFLPGGVRKAKEGFGVEPIRMTESVQPQTHASVPSKHGQRE